MAKRRKDDPFGELTLFTNEYIDFLREDQAIGRAFVACHEPVTGVSRRVLSSARLEVSAGDRMPRILVNPGLLRPEDFSVEKLQADAAILHKLVTGNPKGFKKLTNLVNDPKGFTRQAKRLGLTESDFARQGGGIIEELVVFLACMLMTGCSGGSGSSGGRPRPAKCIVTLGCTVTVTGGAAVAQDYSVVLSFTPASSIPHPVDHNYVYGFITYDKGGSSATATSPPKERVSVVRGGGRSPTDVTVTLPFDVYPPGTVLFIKYGYTCPTRSANTETSTSVSLP